jgi:hypothetical protein
MSEIINEIKEAITASDLEQARTLLRQALNENPSAEIYFLAAQAAINEQQKKMFLEKTLAADPFHAEAYNALNNTHQVVANRADIESTLVKQPTQQVKNNLQKSMLVLMLCIGIPLFLLFMYQNTSAEGKELLSAFDAGAAECKRYQQGTVDEINCTTRLDSLGNAMMSSLNRAMYLGLAFLTSLVVSIIALIVVFLFRHKIFFVNDSSGSTPH